MTTSIAERENHTIAMETYTRVSFIVIVRMVLAFTKESKTVLFMLATGTKINNMALAVKSGTTVLAIWANIKCHQSWAKVSTIGPMETSI